jgi:hypothetical protein
MRHRRGANTSRFLAWAVSAGFGFAGFLFRAAARLYGCGRRPLFSRHLRQDFPHVSFCNLKLREFRVNRLYYSLD